MISFLSFALPLALYLAWPSTLWNFDGVACAAALELGDSTYFFHANHLIYGFFGNGFWKFIGIPSGLVRALPALQLFTSLLAAFGLIAVHRLTLSILKSPIAALLLTIGLSVTAAFWVWSVEAQVYTLGFLPLAWATYLLIGYEGPRKYLWVGLLHAAAVLGHVLHILWAIPALYWMWGQREDVRRYLKAFFLAALIPYALVLSFVMRPRRDLPHILIWLKGSAGLNPDRIWAWHFSGRSGPWIWLKSTAPALWGAFWPYGGVKITMTIWILTGCSIALLLALIFRSWSRRQEKMWKFSWVWIAVYGLFLSTWEPGTLCYRLTDIIPLGILLALGMNTWPSALQIALTSVWLASTGAVNLSTRIYPMKEIERNTIYQDTLALSKITPSNSLYITSGGPPWLYLLYFTGRTAWNAQAVPPEILKEAITREKRRRPVYILKGSVWQKAS